MNCPKCGSKIISGCCIKCGYLITGNKIENKDIDKCADLKLFNKEFEIINRNKKLYLIFLLGPLYFSYRGYFVFGTILGLIDYFLFYNFMLLSSNLVFSTVMCYIYIFLNRILYVIFSNSICIFIDKLKINRIKNKYKENYKNKLIIHKHHKYYLLFTILVYIILIIIFVIIRRIKNGLL